MAMVNDENAAPSQANARMSLTAGKLTDAVTDLKVLLSRRGSKRPAPEITENSKKKDDIQDEVQHIEPASKRAKLETWWRDAASAVSIVRSSVSETAVEKVTQVRTKLCNIPDWMQSRTTAAKALFEAAAKSGLAQKVLALKKGAQGEAEETPEAVAANSTSIDDDSPKSLASTCNVSSQEAATDNAVATYHEGLIAQTMELQDGRSNFDGQSEEAVVPEILVAKDDVEHVLSNQEIAIDKEEVVQVDEFPDAEHDVTQGYTMEVPEVALAEDDLEHAVATQEAGVVECALDNEEVVQTDNYFHLEQDVIQEDTMDVPDVRLAENDFEHIVDCVPDNEEVVQTEEFPHAGHDVTQEDTMEIPEVPLAEDDIEQISSNQEIVVVDWVLDNEEVVQEDEFPHVAQDVVQEDTMEVDMMPHDSVDPLPFDNEADQALEAGFAANQAADIDFIVDSQGVEWFPVHDNSTGDVYYWNQRTGETTWTRPVTTAEAVCGA